MAAGVARETDGLDAVRGRENSAARDPRTGVRQAIVAQSPDQRKDQAMKLDGAQLKHVEDQLGVEAVPDENPAMPKLQEVFGDHSFFVDAAGLNIVEPKPDGAGAEAAVLKVASWAEDGQSLQVHEPQILSVTVDVSTAGPDGADPTA